MDPNGPRAPGNSHEMFKNVSSAPVLLWLQGGPGASSLMALFVENGPYILDTEGELQRRDIHWALNHNIIYLDNPAGTGFSFTDSDLGYARNQTDVAENVYAALVQFFQLFPELQENDFYVTGESYGDYFYQLGLIDINARERFHQMEAEVVQAIREERWTDASNQSIAWVLVAADRGEDNERFEYFINLNASRLALHVGDREFHDSSEVSSYLYDDYMKSVKPWLEVLLENYRVLMYNGQLDIICAYPLTANLLRNLEWSGADDYKTAERSQWLSGGKLAGFVKTAGNLTEILVRNAGHLVPTSQPAWSYDLITRFTSGLSYS
uniref:Carboxypeptidase n=1 Tax=Timema bartmani TaxID=61472 RepID=A0A7R9HZU8_9NEOP|nr:unnamed protein product [Timema bartmani]